MTKILISIIIGLCITNVISYLWLKYKFSKLEGKHEKAKAQLAELHHGIEERDSAIQKLENQVNKIGKSGKLANDEIDALRREVANCREPVSVKRRLGEVLLDLQNK